MPLDIQPVTFHVSNSHSGHGPIQPHHVTATLHGLHGNYSITDLYARYRSIAREEGAHPGSKGYLGRAIRQLGHTSWRTATQRGWTILGN